MERCGLSFARDVQETYEKTHYLRSEIGQLVELVDEFITNYPFSAINSHIEQFQLYDPKENYKISKKNGAILTTAYKNLKESQKNLGDPVQKAAVEEIKLVLKSLIETPKNISRLELERRIQSAAGFRGLEHTTNRGKDSGLGADEMFEMDDL